MREVDRLTTEQYGISQAQLMEHAGKAVAEYVLHQLAAKLATPARRVVVLCGKGNNGGDGFVAARYLRAELKNTTAVLLGAADEMRGDALQNYQRWRELNGETLYVRGEEEWEKAAAAIEGTEVVLDAMLGTGLRGAATGYVAK